MEWQVKLLSLVAHSRSTFPQLFPSKSCFFFIFFPILFFSLLYLFIFIFTRAFNFMMLFPTFRSHFRGWIMQRRRKKVKQKNTAVFFYFF